MLSLQLPLVPRVAQDIHHNHNYRLQEHSNMESSRSIRNLCEPSLSGPGTVPFIIQCLPWCGAQNKDCRNAEVTQRQCQDCKELRANLWWLSVKERDSKNASEGNQLSILRVRRRGEEILWPYKLKEQRKSRKNEELSLSNIENKKKQS